MSERTKRYSKDAPESLWYAGSSTAFCIPVIVGRKNKRPVTARRNDHSVEYAFGCSRVLPSNKE